MSITSYAQNFEDVMLWRALGHIPNGFYIDVGAQHPVIDSVSKAFYEHGWRGVHVEATPVYATLVRADRPDEIVLQVALSDKPGSLTFYEIPDTGLSTGDASIAEHHRARGYNVMETVVNCITLADVLTQVGQQDVHWLKIDVEGMEAQVLAGWGDNPVRPWVLVVESTYPNSQVETHQAWEGMVLARGYVHTYFDGLSRYYVLADRPDLAQKFDTPPNIFDGFSLALSVPYNGPTRDLMQQKEQRYQDELTGERANATHELQTVRETLAQREDALGAHISQLQQQFDSTSEQQIAALAARDAEAVQQIETLHQQHIDEFLRNEAKERELNTSMQQLLHQAEQEKTQLVNGHNEEEQTLRRQHTEREQGIAQQLQTSQEERIRLQQGRIEREQTLLAQTNQAKQEVEALLRAQVQREQAVAEKLEAVRSQATRESADLARTFTEHQHNLHSQHAAREQALNQRLEAGHEQRQLLQQERTKREQTLLEQTSKAKQEVENLLRFQAQREREVLAQLLIVQQQATREKAELTCSHAEKVRELGSQQAQREKALTQQLHAHQQQLRNLQKGRVKSEQETAQEKADFTRNHNEQEHALLRQQADREKTHSQQRLTQEKEFFHLQLEQSKREQALLEEHRQTLQQLEELRLTMYQREQEMLAQLLASQQQAGLEKAELLEKQSEQKQVLHSKHTERESALTQQLQEQRQLLQRQQEDWARLEQELNNEIATLQGKTQTLHQTQQLQAQQHSFEISTKLDEKTCLLEAYAALKVQLQKEMQSGQQASLHLRQLLAEVQQALDTTHASLTWRLTAPLRQLASLICPCRNPGTASPVMDEAASPCALISAVTETLQVHVQQKTVEPLMMSSTPITATNTPVIAATLDELLACHDLHFVRSAYQTLLGREPDPDGLKYYKKRLNAGYSKIGLLKQIRASAEGGLRTPNVLGLDQVIKKYKWGRMPIIGRVFRLLNPFVSDCEMKRKFRIIERQLHSLNQECMQRFDRLENLLCKLDCNDNLKTETKEQFPSSNSANRPAITQQFQKYTKEREESSGEYIKSRRVKTPLEHFGRKIHKIEK